MNRISISGRGTTHAHEPTYGRQASPLSGHPSAFPRGDDHATRKRTLAPPTL
jgi:hypothetical protein